MSRLATLALAAFLLAGCRRGDPPADRYRAFVAAARAGEGDAVWDGLSAASRAALDARAKAASAQAPDGVVPASGKELVLGDLASSAPRLKSVVLLRESSGAAVLAVEDEAGARSDVTLVREAGAWKVVVPGLAAPGG